MRKILTASIEILALAVAVGSASAADIPRRQPPTKAPVVYVPPVYNWTGLYVGINGGGSWGRSSFSAPFATDSFGLSGGMVGGTLGYNWQVNQAVFGLESDLDWSNVRGNTVCGATVCETRNKWLGTVRGRLGYAMDRFMPYVTGGLAVGNINTSIAGVGSADATKAGWTVGGGIEAALGGPVTAKVEYLYVDLGRGGTVAGSSANFHSHVMRAGLNYRF